MSSGLLRICGEFLLRMSIGPAVGIGSRRSPLNTLSHHGAALHSLPLDSPRKVCDFSAFGLKPTSPYQSFETGRDSEQGCEKIRRKTTRDTCEHVGGLGRWGGCGIRRWPTRGLRTRQVPLGSGLSKDSLDPRPRPTHGPQKRLSAAGPRLGFGVRSTMQEVYS